MSFYKLDISTVLSEQCIKVIKDSDYDSLRTLVKTYTATGKVVPLAIQYVQSEFKKTQDEIANLRNEPERDSSDNRALSNLESQGDKIFNLSRTQFFQLIPEAIKLLNRQIDAIKNRQLEDGSDETLIKEAGDKIHKLESQRDKLKDIADHNPSSINQDIVDNEMLNHIGVDYLVDEILTIELENLKRLAKSYEAEVSKGCHSHFLEFLESELMKSNIDGLNDDQIDTLLKEIELVKTNGSLEQVKQDLFEIDDKIIQDRMKKRSALKDSSDAHGQTIESLDRLMNFSIYAMGASSVGVVASVVLIAALATNPMFLAITGALLAGAAIALIAAITCKVLKTKYINEKSVIDHTPISPPAELSEKQSNLNSQIEKLQEKITTLERDLNPPKTQEASKTAIEFEKKSPYEQDNLTIFGQKQTEEDPNKVNELNQDSYLPTPKS